MARTVQNYTVDKVGRDKGKTFVITEMSARDAHRWATKALFAVMNAGVELADESLSMGMAGLMMAGMGSITKIPHAIAEPLLEELLGCVQIKQELTTRDLFDGDIEEAVTYFDLQRVVLTMHIQPFISGGGQNSASAPPNQAAAG